MYESIMRKHISRPLAKRAISFSLFLSVFSSLSLPSQSLPVYTLFSSFPPSLFSHLFHSPMFQWNHFILLSSLCLSLSIHYHTFSESLYSPLIMHYPPPPFSLSLFVFHFSLPLFLPLSLTIMLLVCHSGLQDGLRDCGVWGPWQPKRRERGDVHHRVWCVAGGPSRWPTLVRNGLVCLLHLDLLENQS